MVVLTLVACTTAEEQGRIRRVWEMQDHEQAYRDARDALLRGDLKTAQQAGVDLAHPDPVPGLPADGLPHLTAVRAGGQALSVAPTLEAASTTLVAITADCAACHAALKVAVPPLKDDARELLWNGLVFESEPSWQGGLAKLGDPAWSSVTSWADRRAAVAAALPTGKP